MMKLVFTFFGLTILILLLGFPSFGAWVGSTDDAMTIGGGARPIGMGRAFTAIADDADAPFINPAGIAGIKGPSAMAMYTNLLDEVYYREFSGAVPTPFGTFGMGYITTGVNNIPTVPVPTDYYDSLVLATFSVPLARYFTYGNNIFVGANYKIYNRGYVGGINNVATGTSADIGLKYIHSPNLSFGLCRQNFLPVSMGGVIRLSSGAEESLASLLKLGIAVRPNFLPNLLLALDNDIPEQSGRPAIMHMGAEWKIIEYLTLRAGLDQSVDPTASNRISTNPSVGTSFGVGSIRIDYAYHAYYNDASLATHYVSLSYTGEPWFALKGRIE
jgi:hypothetical protein